MRKIIPIIFLFVGCIFDSVGLGDSSSSATDSIPNTTTDITTSTSSTTNESTSTSSTTNESTSTSSTTNESTSTSSTTNESTSTSSTTGDNSSSTTSNEVCGNNEIENGEECDDGPDGSFECTVNCTKSFCGDGIINPLSAEYCDDGNKIDKDSCSTECMFTLRIFLSKFKYLINQLGSVEEADKRCNEEAKKYGLTGKYKAWISGITMESSPYLRFGTSNFKGWYVSITDVYITKGWIGLGLLDNPINIQPDGQEDLDPNGQVWTNTKTNGEQLISDSNYSCIEWSSSNFRIKGVVGSYNNIKMWNSNGVPLTCDNSAKLYCFEVY